MKERVSSVSLIAIAILGLWPWVAQAQFVPSPIDGPRISLTTARDVGQAVQLSIKADEADKANVWIDLNGDNAYQRGEEVTNFGPASDYTIGASTMTIYGKVTKLFCYKNQLTTLDVTKNPILNALYCNGNELKGVDVSQNPALIILECYTNQIQNLDLSQNPALKRLLCNDNGLKTLDLSQNLALTDLSCNNNELERLDVSKNTALGRLYCQSNQITEIEMPEKGAFIQVLCYSNNIKDKEAMDKIVNSLPAMESEGPNENYGRLVVINSKDPKEANVCTKSQAAIAKGKNWGVRDFNGAYSEMLPYEGSNDTSVVDISAESPTIRPMQGKICISGVERGLPIHIYNVRGEVVYESNGYKSADVVLPAGAYVVRVGSYVTKAMVR